MTVAIKISDVIKKYQGSSDAALENINLEIKKNETVGIIGENGSGKSTLLKLIAGYLEPTNGSILINQKIEPLFDAEILSSPELSPFELANQFLYLKGISKNISEKIKSIEDFCNIGKRFHDPFYTLSLGMKARVQFAIKTSFYSEIVLVDEVLGAGDITTIKRSSDRVKEIAMNSTFICVSHNLSQIKYLCKRCIWIKDKKIFKDSDSDEVIKEYQKYMENKIQKISSNNVTLIEYDDSYTKIIAWINKNLKILNIKNEVQPIKKLDEIICSENQLPKIIDEQLGKKPNSFLAINESRNAVVNCFQSEKISNKIDALVYGKWLVFINVHSVEKNDLLILKFNIKKNTHSDPPVILLPCNIFDETQKGLEIWNSTKC